MCKVQKGGVSVAWNEAHPRPRPQHSGRGLKQGSPTVPPQHAVGMEVGVAKTRLTPRPRSPHVVGVAVGVAWNGSHLSASAPMP